MSMRDYENRRHHLMVAPPGRRCSALDCDQRCAHSDLMCAFHWKKVPMGLKQALAVAYNKDRYSKDYILACKRAIHSVTPYPKGFEPDASQAIPTPPVSPSAAGTKEITP